MKGKVSTLFAVLVLLIPTAFLKGSDFARYTINRVLFKFETPGETKNIPNYRALLNFKEGDYFSYKNIRKSMDNLYRTGSFENIEVKVETLPDRQLNVHFFMKNKYRINDINIREDTPLKKSTFTRAIFSLRKNAYFEPTDLRKAIEEIKGFLRSRGYNNPSIEYIVDRRQKEAGLSVKFIIRGGGITSVNKVNLTVTPEKFYRSFNQHFIIKKYIPHDVQQAIEKIKRDLKKQHYYFPEIAVKEVYLNPQKSSVDLNIDIHSGYRYLFKFEGMRENMGILSSIWEKKVFEKWAEAESRARILDFLKNKGYLNAEVESGIEVQDSTRLITFKVKKNRKYTLGNITITGNQAIPKNKLKELIKTGDQVYDRLFGLRLDSLQVDLEVLKLFYYFNGFPFARIAMDLQLAKRTADIHFEINEGKKVTVESILVRGNNRFKSEEILGRLKTQVNGPFVEQRFNEDLDRIKELYYQAGYTDIDIKPEISPGLKKSVLITINEGDTYKMGDLIVFGASKVQRNLIKNLFPLKRDGRFNRNQIDRFKNELENNGIFSEINIENIKKETGTMDVLVKVVPDDGKFYGFGIGWEDARALRGSLRWTLEYQEQNIFRSYSSFAALFQIGTREDRIALSYDSPYFLKQKINSSLLLWNENETYPTYKFNRKGIGESIGKKITADSYILASLKWYRTTLKELDVSESGVDRLDIPFDTTAFSLVYVIENRDDPFNPREGEFFTSNLKIGFPLLEKDYTFFKFLWGYQKNFKFLKNGSFSFSVRNGFAAGDMSITERFFAGGLYSFRGTYNDRLGPIDPFTQEPRGGNAMVLFNLEATFPLVLVPIEDLYYCFFADVGNIFWRASDFDINKMERAIGFGIKYKTPLGPLRLDFGFNLREKAEHNFLVHIGIGNVF